MTYVTFSDLIQIGRKGVVPVTYVTFSDLIQIGILVVGIIALFQNIKKK